MLTLYELVVDSDIAVESGIAEVVGLPTSTALISLVSFPFVHDLLSALPVSVPLGLFVVNKRSEVIHLPWPLLPLVRPEVEIGGDHPFGRLCPSSTVFLA